MSKNVKKSASGKAGENLRVVVRCRNLLAVEIERGDTPCVKLDLSTHQAIVQSPGDGPQVFAFDAVYTNFHSQKEIFMREVQPMIDAVLQGYNATVFAYGQSGSGKTYTMTGNIQDSKLWGMMPQTVESLFAEIRQQSTPGKQYKVKCSYIELYNGKARDLLAPKQTTLDIKENSAKNFYVKGVEVPEISSLDECLRLFNAGTDRRQTATTDLNDQSSRSHSLFILQVEQHDFEQDPSSPTVFTSKINIVDLAGSEKLSKSGATGSTAIEGCSINLSLSALAAVIDTIVKGAPHIPYRSSPLTMLLKDSLGGNAKTVMFANLGPSDKNAAETLSTLRFALRAKQIENKPIKNMDPKDARIQELLEKVEDLQKKHGIPNHMQELERLTGRLDELELERAQRNGEYEKMELQLTLDAKRLQYEIEEMQRSRKNVDAEMNRSRERIASLEASLVREQATSHEIRATVRDFLRRGLIQDQLDELQRKMRRGSDGLSGQWPASDIQNHFDQLLQQLQAQQQALKTTEELRKQAAAALEDKAAEVVHLQGEISRMRVGDAQKRDTETDQIVSLRTEVTRLTSELKAARANDEQRTAQAAKTESQMRAELSRLQDDNKKLVAAAASNNNKSASGNPSALTHRPSQVNELAAQVAALKDENAALRQRMQKELDAMRKQSPVRFAPTAARVSPKTSPKTSGFACSATISVDMLSGMPTETWCVRVLVYMADLDEDEAIPVGNDDLYDRLPDLLCIQDLASPTCEPTFSDLSNCSTTVQVRDNSRAVVIVECLFGKQWATYGHAVLPIGRGLTKKGGCFTTRLRLGDPRQNKSTAENPDLDHYSSILRSRLATVPATCEEYIPLAVVQWRKDAAVLPRQVWEMIESPPFSPAELQMKKDRAGLALLDRTPASFGIQSLDDANRAFDDQKRAADSGDAISLFAPHTKDRSAFVWVEKIVGLWPSSAPSEGKQAPGDKLFKVLARVDDSFGISRFHDFTAHCNFPTFLLEPILFPNLTGDDKLCVWFTVFSVSTKPKLPGESDSDAIVPIAWSVAKLFVGKQFLRHGRVSIPLFEGIAPPAEFVEEVTRASLEESIVTFLSHEKIAYHSPRSLIVLAQGDSARFDEVTARFPPSSPKGGGPTGGGPAGSYVHRCKRKLVRRLNIPEFDAIEMSPPSAGPNLDKILVRQDCEANKALQTRINERVTEYLKNDGLEEFRTGERKLSRKQSIFQRFFN